MKINNKYSHGDMVYMVSDPSQDLCVVDEIIVLPTLLLKYKLKCAGEEYICYDFEISDEKNPIITMNLNAPRPED